MNLSMKQREQTYRQESGVVEEGRSGSLRLTNGNKYIQDGFKSTYSLSLSISHVLGDSQHRHPHHPQELLSHSPGPISLLIWSSFSFGMRDPGSLSHWESIHLTPCCPFLVKSNRSGVNASCLWQSSLGKFGPTWLGTACSPS